MAIVYDPTDTRPCPPGFARYKQVGASYPATCLDARTAGIVSDAQAGISYANIFAVKGIYAGGQFTGLTSGNAYDINQSAAFFSRYQPRTDWLGQAAPYIIGATQLAASALVPGFGVAAGVAQAATSVETSARTNMALNIGALLGGIGQAIGGIQGGAISPYTSQIGSVLQAGGQIASAFAPQPAAQPISYPYGSAVAIPTMAAAGPVMRTVGSGMLAGAGGAALRDISRQIAQKASQFLGKSLSTAGLVAIARKMAKFFTSPEAIATYLGVTVGELYTVWSYEAAKKRRRINPANGKALRRAASRIKSFHKLCQHTDLLKTRRRTVRSCAKVC